MSTMRLITKSLLFLALTGIPGYATYGQKPVIRAVNKINAGLNETVSLDGNAFGDDPSKVTVFFGGTKGTVESISDQTMEVKVPAGAIYDNISVTNVASGLTGYSREHFFLSFGGNHGFNPANLEGQKDFNTESGLYDLCMCDLDGDNRVDIASANDNSNFISILANTTTAPGVGNITFNKIPFNLGTKSLHVKCGDLNGDGKPDLIVSEGGSNGDRVFILQNTSIGMGSFTFSVQPIKLIGKKVKQVAIADLDRDGKPELTITNQSGNNLSILVNQSTPASVIFSPSPIIVNVSAFTTDGIAVEDLNGDFFPEIVTSQYLTASNVYVIKNTSTPGNIAMGTISTLTIGGFITNIKIGDLDTDSKPDIVVTQLLGSGISIFRNQSNLTSLNFEPPKNFTTEERPWGIDFGDLDGDGRSDIIVASITKKTLTVLNNKSTTGNLTFQSFVKNTTFINRHVNIGDVDNDGKPDVAFTSIDDIGNGIPASKISVFRNKTCLVPAITPAGPLNICTSYPLKLFSNAGRGITYEWRNGATVVTSGQDPFFDVSASGNYSVTATAESGTCSLTSNTVNVTVSAGSANAVEFLSPAGPVCIGGTLNLAVKDEGHQYLWTGPDNYTGSTSTPAAVPNFQLKNAGRYFLKVKAGTCIALDTSIVVSAIDAPEFQITYSGSPVFCTGAKSLAITPAPANYSYQWFKDNVSIGGATASTYSASQSGSYTVKASNAGCGVNVNTQPVKITLASMPTSDFIAPAETCVGQNVSLNNQSTSDPAAELFYDWDFGDGSSSIQKNPTHKFLTDALRTITLKVSYKDLACLQSASKSINVKSAPPVNISNPGNKYKFCPGDSLKLEVAGTFSSYQWNTSQTTSSIYVKKPGTYSVIVKTSECILNATKVIEVFPEPQVIITADPAMINEGESSQLMASGLLFYLWSPAETLSNVSISNPIASPLTTTSYKVSGKDVNECTAQSAIEVIVKGEPIVSKLKPSNFISPSNGDDINQFWRIEKIDQYTQCGIAIFDEKGINVYEAKPYLNDWDGTYKGKKLPDGVYFYVIRCDGEENKPKTGSITILR